MALIVRHGVYFEHPLEKKLMKENSYGLNTEFFFANTYFSERIMKP